MAAHLHDDEAGTRGVRRLLRKEVGKALEAVESGQPPSDAAVHEARKRLKKARAALRLLRPAIGGGAYRRENTCCRDAARPLTEVRDALVMVKTVDGLGEHLGEQPEEGLKEGLAALRQAMQEQYEEARRRVLGPQDALAGVKEALRAARGRMDELSVGRKGWSVLGAGLEKTYRQGRDALAATSDEPTVESLHEWRKQAKYLWHQLQALEPLWPAVIEQLADQAHELGTKLGDDHDLAVLRDKVKEQPAREALERLVDRRRDELQAQALEVGRRLYEEAPKDFAGRFKGYWRAWRKRARALA